MFCQLLSILSIIFYCVLKERLQLNILHITVNLINTILPCAEGQGSAACSAGHSKSYQYNCTRVLKGRIQLYVLPVTVNPINTIVPYALGQFSSACSAD